MINTWKLFCKYFNPENIKQIRNEFLWFNPYIIINKKTVFYKHWYIKGIKYINDIVDENGVFLTQEILERTFDLKVNFLEYLSLPLSILGHRKQSLRNKTIRSFEPSFIPRFMLNGQLKFVTHVTCKEFYWCIINFEMSESPTCLETWTPMFNISDSDWPKIFTLSFKFTIESKIQAFQFAMLHRFVVHKARLFKMQLVDSELCDACLEKDTILHRFWECPNIRLFWNNFEEWWNSLYPSNRNLLSAKIIILGCYSTHCKYAFNNCILQAKHFIHKQLCNKRQVSFQSFLTYLKHKVSVEQHVLYSQGKYDLFEKRWFVIFSNIS